MGDENNNYNGFESKEIISMVIKLFAVVAVLCVIWFVYYTLSENCIISPHEWTEATCTEPKTCEKCGETEGQALGHEWTEATCTEPKTCKRCGKTEGAALGHSYSEFTIVKNPTCIEKGSKEAVCSVCGDKKTEDIPVLGHKPGEWEITQEATLTSVGKKIQKCTVCGEIVNSDNYELSADEKRTLSYSIYDVSTRISSGSYVYIYFKVKNNTSVDAKMLHITGTLYDANNTPMTSAGIYINNLPSGQFEEEYVLIKCSEPFSYYDLKVDRVGN